MMLKHRMDLTLNLPAKKKEINELMPIHSLTKLRKGFHKPYHAA